MAGSISGPASLDPALARDLSVNFMLAQMYRGLMTLDLDLVPQPGLAASIEMLDAGARYRFQLRAEARFHDGRTVTAEDVQRSLSRALNPDIAGGNVAALAATTYLGDIVGADAVLEGAETTLQGVTVTDDSALEIALVQPSPTFLMRLASIQASIVDVEQIDANGGWPEHPNGSGPFVLESWDPGTELLLNASDRWWEGRPALPTVTFLLGANAVQPLNLYQADRVDLVESAPLDQIALIRDPASGLLQDELEESLMYAVTYIAMGNHVPPLDDVHVRRALQLVFPVERFVQGRFGSVVSVAKGLVPPGMLGEAWPVEMPTVNVEAARAELALSRFGSADAVPPILIYAADTEPVEALRDVARTELGLEVQVIEVPFGEFVSGLAERRFPAYSIYWGADYPDPESLLEMLFGEFSADNYTGYVNPEFTDLLAQAQSATGLERIAALSQANQLLIDDVAVIPLYYPRAFSLVRTGIDGLRMTPMGLSGLELLTNTD